jgi:predicted RND superfamily exporter protein
VAAAAGRWLQRALSSIILASARRALAVVGVVALLSVVSVAILATVEPNVETDIQAGYFATYDDQANAFRELRSRVAGVNSEIVYFELRDDAHGFNPGSGADEPVDNVTDVPALLAQEELFQFVKAEFRHRTGHDKVLSHTSLPYFYKLIYAQFPNGDFAIPTSPPEHQATGQLVISAGGPSINLYHSQNESRTPEASWDAAVMFLIYDPDTTHLSKKETGGLVNEIIEDYRALEVGQAGDAGVTKTYDMWKDEYFDSWGVQSWIYRIDEQVNKEAKVFTAAVFAFLTVVLLFLLRSVKRVLIGISTLGIILLWTLAGMTAGGVSIGFISMAMFPLILGVGVDYVIHIMNEFGAERGQAASSEEAFAAIGRRGAVALLIATLTTLSGFAIFIVSTSPMIVEICVATLLGILGIYVLSITFIPAMLHLTVKDERREVFHPSRAIGAFATFLGRHKALPVVVLLAGSAVFALQVPKVEYVIGTVEVNLPQKELWTHGEDRAHMLDMYERFQTHIKATGQETVITQGDGPGSLAKRAAVDDMIRIHQAMVADPFVQASGGAVNSVPFILNLYAILQDGIQSAGPAVLEDVVQGGALIPCPAAPGAPGLPLPPPAPPIGEGLCYPGLDPAYDPTFAHIKDWDDDDIAAAYADMLAREEFAPLLLTFMDRDASIAWALTFVNIHIDQSATQKADDAFSTVLEKAAPSQTDNHYFGTLTGIKKYNDYTNFWLTMSSVASFLVVLLLSAVFIRRWRAVLAIATPMLVTFLWWLGVLPLIDIQIAFVFLIPVAFITSMGSDYAVHLAWASEQPGARPPDVWRTTGKGVAYSAFTTFVSFLIFSRGAIRGSYEMFVACVAAIVIITVATFLCVPLFYKWPRKGEEPGAPRTVPDKQASKEAAR